MARRCWLVSGPLAQYDTPFVRRFFNREKDALVQQAKLDAKHGTPGAHTITEGTGDGRGWKSLTCDAHVAESVAAQRAGDRTNGARMRQPIPVIRDEDGGGL
jgi:hypothetical protein